MSIDTTVIPGQDYDHWHVAELVEQMRQGDQQAWTEVVDTFMPMMARVAIASGAREADAQDIAQQSFITLFRKVDTLTQPERLAGWLKMVTWRNAARHVSGTRIDISADQLHYEPEHAEVFFEDQIDVLPEEALLSAEREANQQQLLDEMPQQRQEIMDMLLQGHSYKAIAEMLSVPIGTIGSTRARAAEDLRRANQRLGFEFDDVLEA